MTGADDALPRGTERWIEALTWHERLDEAGGSQLITTVISEWQAWYSDPENRLLFEHLTLLVSDARAQTQRAACLSRDIDADDYDFSIPLETWRSRRLSRAVSGHWQMLATRRSWLVVGVAAVVLAAIAALLPQPPWRWMGTDHGYGSSIYQTDVGGLQDVDLGDGSEITLGGKTRLVVRFTAAARFVDLVRGEAWFKVAHDLERPFVVRAGEGAIRDVGTAFLVRRDSDRVVVTVTQGVVAVSPSAPVSLSPAFVKGAASGLLPAPIRVPSGEQISYHDNGVVASVAHADANVATAWIYGRLVFDNEPLRYVVEDVNRYFPRHILATAAAGKLRFSGVILDDEITGWLHGLPLIVPVDVDEHGADICIHMRSVETTAQCVASR